jgi:RHS repeat-associated protein
LLYEVAPSYGTNRVLTYHFDYRGNTVAMTDGGGNVTDRVSYSPYGSIVARTGTNDTPFLFNGIYGVHTEVSGLYYMRARFYNPTICRFVNPDPSALNRGLNLYTHANGNPVSMIDPLGLCADSPQPSQNTALPENPLQLLWNLLYTGQWNPTQSEYDQDVAIVADYWYNEGGVRGVYAGLGVNAKIPGYGSPAWQAGLTEAFSVDEGTSLEYDSGFGFQERGYTSRGVVSLAAGYGQANRLLTDNGFVNPLASENVAQGAYLASANRVGGEHLGVSGSHNLQIGMNFGAAYGGIIIDPSKVTQNIVDTYYVLTIGYVPQR